MEGLKENKSPYKFALLVFSVFPVREMPDSNPEPFISDPPTHLQSNEPPSLTIIGTI